MLTDSDDTSVKNQVTLMTVHSSKGLEFDKVFICGFEEGVFPHQKSLEENNLEEERRLCYVAITRAKNHLIITSAATRKKYNEDVRCKVSRFLKEIPRELFANDPETALEQQKNQAKSKIADLLEKIKQKYN